MQWPEKADFMRLFFKFFNSKFGNNLKNRTSMPKSYLFVAEVAAFACSAIFSSCHSDGDIPYSLALSTDRLDFPAVGGSLTVTASTESASPVEVSASGGWITAVADGRTVAITVAPADTARTGTVYITVEEAGTGTVKIVQAGPDPADRICVAPASCEFPAEGGDTEFTVTSESEGWTAEVVGDGFSLKGEPDGDRITVTAAPNKGEARNGKLTVSHNGHSAEATLSQNARERSYRHIYKLEGFYMGDSDAGATWVHIEARADDSPGTLVLWAFSSLRDYKGFEFDEGDYSVSLARTPRTLYLCYEDSPYPSYVIAGTDEIIYRIVGGAMHVARNGSAYALTMELMAIDTSTGEETELCYNYAGEIEWQNAVGTYGYPYGDRVPQGSLELADIKEGYYAASGVPSYAYEPGPGTWTSNIINYYTGGRSWWIEGWGHVPVQNAGYIILDYYPGKKNVAVNNYSYSIAPYPEVGGVYIIGEVIYKRDDETFHEASRIEVASPRWESDVIDFSVIRGPEGEETMVGVALYEIITWEFMGFCTELYKNAKLVYKGNSTWTAPTISGESVGVFNGVTGLYDLPGGMKLENPTHRKKKPIYFPRGGSEGFPVH